ncbi:RHS repeat-associated core domain-containing protein [Polaribacter sp.]|uniref:RHS repeat-associated core domain-containing protein n=1 Tax=Polaribacter sp. TaxID=1920175 RepID=UPI003EF41358
MRKIILTLFLSFTILSSAQNVPKGVLAGLIFEVLYGSNYNLNDNPAINYPNPFVDLQENSDLFIKLRIISHLDYGDGIAPLLYTNNSTAFFPDINSTKGEALVAIMEAWNIPPATTGSSPFTDIPTNSPFFGYAKKAVDLGIISNSNSVFSIAEEITQDQFVLWMANLINNTSYHPISTSILNNSNNYFEPNTYSPYNIGISRGLEQAVFSHYAKNSFVIPDRKLNLNFSHYYSTQMVELPQTYFPIKPLGRGWTHTYNSYIIREDDVIGEDDLFYVVWPDGSIHIFNKDEDEYITKGVYDEFDEDSSTRIYITKKNQVRYKYQKLDSDRQIYYLVEIRDSNYNEINIEYENAEEDDTKRIETVESPSGKKLEFRYRDDTDLIERIEDPIGRKIYFDYSGVSGSWVYKYPVLIEFDDAKGNSTVYNYGVNNAFDSHLLKRIELPEGNEIKAEYDDNNNGKLESYKVNNNDEIEIETDFDFGSDTPLHSEVIMPMPQGGTQKYKYDYNENGVLTNYKNDVDDVSISYPTSSSSNVPLLPTSTTINGLDIDYDYDSDGNLEEVDIENGDSVKKYEYDNDNNLTQYTDPEGNITKFSYDSNENLIEIEDALGNKIYYTYDAYGQLLSVTNQEGIAIEYTYENDGAVATITAPEGISSTFDYDGINRLLSKTVNGLTSEYTYDKNDNLTSFTNSGNLTTSYNYNKNDNIKEIKNTKGVKTSFDYNDKDQVISETFGGLEKNYRYNDDGSLERFTKPSGDRIDYEYDNDGRLEKIGTISNIEYNNKNLVDEITNDTGTMEFKYDNLNRLDEVTTVHNYEIKYDYEKTGLIEEIEYPTINGVEFAVEYNYDKKNRVSSIELHTNDVNDGKQIAVYDYKDDDRLEDIIYNNQIKRSLFYDDAGRLDRVLIFNRNTSDVIYRNDLTLDIRGNIIRSEEIVPEIETEGTYGGNPSGPTDTSIYSYNNTNHAETIAGLNHTVNNDGNTTEISNNIEIEYDINDRLTKYRNYAKVFYYKYNAYGQRVEQVKDGVSHKYIRDVRTDNVLIDVVDGNVEYYYIYTPSGKLVARMTPSGDLSYYHSDVRGSTVAITNEDADITHKYRYSDFGKVTKQEEPETVPNRYKYVGTNGVETDDPDLYYMRARYYTPSTGRFLTEDPVWSTNLYPYADNNPISNIDSDGKQAKKIVNGAALLTDLAFEGLQAGGHLSLISGSQFLLVSSLITATDQNLSFYQKGESITVSTAIFAGSASVSAYAAALSAAGVAGASGVAVPLYFIGESANDHYYGIKYGYNSDEYNENLSWVGKIAKKTGTYFVNSLFDNVDEFSLTYYQLQYEINKTFPKK